MVFVHLLTFNFFSPFVLLVLSIILLYYMHFGLGTPSEVMPIYKWITYNFLSKNEQKMSIIGIFRGVFTDHFEVSLTI